MHLEMFLVATVEFEKVKKHAMPALYFFVFSPKCVKIKFNYLQLSKALQSQNIFATTFMYTMG